MSTWGPPTMPVGPAPPATPTTPAAASSYTASFAPANETRFTARLLDGILEMVAAAIILALAPHGRPLAGDFLVVAAVVAWETAFIHHLGGTPGKLLLGLRVQQVDRAGNPDPEVAFRRSFAVALCFGVASFGLVVAVPMAVALLVSVILSAHRRAFHDRLSGTVVVRRDAPPLIAAADLARWYSPEDLPTFTPWGRAVGLDERRRARANRLDGSPWLVLAVVVAVAVMSTWLQSAWAVLWLTVAWLVVFVVDETRRVAASGTTPGHAEAGYRIVDVATGEPPGTVRALARAVVLAPLLYLPPFQLLLALWVNASATHRGPHDLAGHTQVVDPRAVPLAAPTPLPPAGWLPTPGAAWSSPAAWGPHGWGPSPPWTTPTRPAPPPPPPPPPPGAPAAVPPPPPPPRARPSSSDVGPF